MADLVFKQGLGSQINGIGFTKTADGVLSAGGAVGGIQNRDVVKISYPDTYQKAVYAICVDQNTGRFHYDENIYPVGLSSITATVYPYNSTDVHEVDVYRVGVDIENGLYSIKISQESSDIFMPFLIIDLVFSLSVLLQCYSFFHLANIIL